MIDEHKGRNVAKKMSVEHIGTVGILMVAFDEGILTAEEIWETLKVMLACDIRLTGESKGHLTDVSPEFLLKSVRLASPKSAI